MKKSSLLVSLALLAALAGCGTTTSSSVAGNNSSTTTSSSVVSSSSVDTTVVLEGEYEETFGKNQDLYVTKVLVTVKDGVILKVEMAEDSNHYTKESTRWDNTVWTNEEANVLKSFEGKTVEEVLAATESFSLVAGATITSNRIFKAVVNALKGDTEEVLAGEYEETFGKNQDLYVTKVLVTVKAGVILKVEMAEDSNHYTKESTRWDNTVWTNEEANVLKSFEGKTVEEVLAATESFSLVAGATITSNRIFKAVVNALSK